MEEIVEDVEENGFLLQVSIKAAEKSRLPWNMLEHNQIQGFLPFRYYYVDNNVCFRYITEGLQPVTEYFQNRKGDFDILFFLCCGIIKIVEKGEEYLLKEEEYFLAPERIYWNRLEKKIALCYLPGKDGGLKNEYTAFVEYLLQNTNHKDERAVKFIYGLYDTISSDVFTLESMEVFFSEFKREPQVKDIHEVSVKKKCSKRFYLVYCGELWKDLPIWKEGLGEYPIPMQEEVLVGRSIQMDMVIPCPEISRSQAVLFQKNHQLFLMDKNSANGTYLNDKIVSSREKIPCREGDFIRFANHTFRLACHE